MIKPEYEVVTTETFKGCSVRCDGRGCYESSRLFVNKQQAQDWLEDRDEDYEEYGQFSEGIERVGEVFHRVAGKLYCARCTEKLIEETKRHAIAN